MPIPKEDATLESLECLEAACRNRGLECARVSENGHVLRVERRGRPLYFLRNKHPFNDYVAGRLAEDKGYQNEFFTRAGLQVPPAIQVFNPFAEARFDRYKTHASVEDMAAEAEERLAYPLLVKKYRSSGSQGVYLERSRSGLEQRLQTLFENSPYGDNILLLQAYVPGPEYRIVATQDELLLAYEKCSEETAVQEDLNPLHHASGRAVRVQDPGLLDAMRTLAAGVAAVIDLGFYAIDLIHGQGGFHILEINPNPFCHFFNKDNGRGEFVRIYERLIEKYVEIGA